MEEFIMSAISAIERKQSAFISVSREQRDAIFKKNGVMSSEDRKNMLLQISDLCPKYESLHQKTQIRCHYLKD